MAKEILIKFSDGERFRLSTDVVHNHNKAVIDDDAIIPYLFTIMRWADVAPHAERVMNKEVFYAEDWGHRTTVKLVSGPPRPLT